MRNRFWEEQNRSRERRSGEYGSEQWRGEQSRRGQRDREQGWDERGMGREREEFEEDESYGRGEPGYPYGPGGMDESRSWRQSGGGYGGREQGWRSGGTSGRGVRERGGSEAYPSAGGYGAYGSEQSGPGRGYEGGQGYGGSQYGQHGQGQYSGTGMGGSQYGGPSEYGGGYGRFQSESEQYGGFGRGRSSGRGAGTSMYGGQSQRPRFAGKGPKGYTRSDERIREEISDALMADDDIDASEIEVEVKNGEVTLSGTVDSRETKRSAEDLVESVQGVRNVQNSLRVQSGEGRGSGLTQAAGGAASESRSRESESRTGSSGSSGTSGSTSGTGGRNR